MYREAQSSLQNLEWALLKGGGGLKNGGRLRAMCEEVSAVKKKWERLKAVQEKP